MMLPDDDRAYVDRAKVTDYRLYLPSLSHSDGRGEAAFFVRIGFRIEAWETLAQAHPDA